MKNRILLLALACIQMYNLFGQITVCEPNLKYKDSTAGIYPRPYNDSTKTGGIDRAACIDTEYEYPLTVIIPDMVTVPVGGVPITLGLESARLDTINAVKGLPKGLKYFCNPGTCNMVKNKPGCVVIKGKATAENKIGQYDLTIDLKLVTALGTFDVTFPGSLFPGKYYINVAAKGSNTCLTSNIYYSNAFKGDINAYPVPTVNNLNIQIMALQAGLSSIAITDISGRIIKKFPLPLSLGENIFDINTADLANGTYFYTVTQQSLGLTKKFTVMR